MDLKQLQGMINNHFQAYVKDLEYITNIDSGANDRAGIRKIADFLADKLKAGGAHTEYLMDDESTHLIARFRGRGKVKILMVAHIDTVFDTGAAKQRPFRMDENKRAYGPGVGDDKATVIQTIYVMKALQSLKSDAYGEIIIFYNGREEIGSQAVEKIITQLAKEVDLCIVMDTARPNWGIVTQRKGRSTYRIDVAGKAGHAGNSSQTAISATVELANQILKFHSLAVAGNQHIKSDTLNIDGAGTTAATSSEDSSVPEVKTPNITVNVGVIGTTNEQVNVVPADAFAEVEIRAFNLSDLKAIDHQVSEFSNNTIVPDAQVTIKGSIQTVPLERTNQVKILADLYRNIVKRSYQATVWEEAAGGVTDGNIAAIYVPTLDGLGIENYDEHTEQEWVDLKTVEPRTVTLVLMIEEICQRWPLW